MSDVLEDEFIRLEEVNGELSICLETTFTHLMRLKILVEKLRISDPLMEEFKEFTNDWKANVNNYWNLSNEQQVILFKVTDNTAELLRERIK
jgi:hypothetical protein